MPLLDTLQTFATDEWGRFVDGVRLLHPDQAQAELERRGHRGLTPGVGRAINVPGWDDVITIRPRYQPTGAERDEYWSARRDGRAANLAPAVLAELDRRRTRVQGMRESAAPGWDRGWAQILTAIDNVQDFTSTVSTLGRLVLWLAPKIAGRLTPGVGAVLLTSDLLNLLSFFGMLAMPVYGFVCAGPGAALAAGAPAALFKRALKAETWTMATFNPFGREARAKRRLRSLGRLPGVSNLLEAAQTTQALYGVGLTLGGLVGMVTESAHAVVLTGQGTPVRVNVQPVVDSFRRSINVPLEERSPGELLVTLQAARVLSTAPAVLARPEEFTDAEVLLTLTAYAAASDHVGELLRGKQWQEVIAQGTAGTFRPVVAPDRFSRAALAAVGVEEPYPAHFPVPGTPGSLSGEEYSQLVALPAAAALERWLLARRWTPAGSFAGALVSATVERWLFTAEEDPELVEWRLAPDQALLAALAESGTWPSVAAEPAALMAFWRELRRPLEAEPRRAPSAPEIAAAAGRHQVDLVTMLPPGSPWPAAWGLNDGGGAITPAPPFEHLPL